MPGPRRGWQERLPITDGAGASARPATRGKSYLQQPAATTSPDRPITRTGTMSQQSQTAVARSKASQQMVMQPASACTPTHHTAAHVTAQYSGTEPQRAVPPLQEYPSKLSVSLSDLSGMSSSISVGASPINITTTDAAGAVTQQHHPQQHQLPAPSNGGAKHHKRQLQPQSAEVWQLSDRGELPTRLKRKHAAVKLTTAGVIEPTATASEAEATEHTDTMSEPSCDTSSVCLSGQESEIEIIYSQNSLDRVTEQQQMQQMQQQSKGLSHSSRNQHKVPGNAVNAPAGQTAAAAELRTHRTANQVHSKSLVTEDSLISGDIEFSSSSVVVAADDTEAVPADPARAEQSAVLTAGRQTQPMQSGTAAAATDAHRVAEANLWVSNGSRTLFESANKQLATSGGSGKRDTSGTAATASAAGKVPSLSPATQTAAAAATATANVTAVRHPPAAPVMAAAAVHDAAAATDQLFATLTAVTRHPHDNSSSSSSSSSDSGSDSSSSSSSSDSGSAGSKFSSQHIHNRSMISFKASTHSSMNRSETLTQADVEVLGAVVDSRLVESQLLPADARDVLTGLEQLHATLQLVKHRPGSSSSSSSEGSEGGESDSSTSSSDLSSRASSRHHDRSQTRAGNAFTSMHRLHGEAGGQAQVHAAAAAAAEAAAEASKLLGTLQVLQQDSYLSYSEDFQALSEKEPSSLSWEQQGWQQAQFSEFNRHMSSKQAHEQNTFVVAAGQVKTVAADNATLGGAAQATARPPPQQMVQLPQPTFSRSGIHDSGNSQTGGEQPPQSCSQATSCDINELLQQQATGYDHGSSKLLLPYTLESPAKRRSIALQVGSSNNKATQVVFDEQRCILWDGGSLLLQQQQQSGTRGPAAAQRRAPPAAAAACGQYHVGSFAAASQRLPSTWLENASGSRRVLAGGPGSCWSVLSATLQQFRAAALLDQLEGLLAQQQVAARTAVQQHMQPAAAALPQDQQTEGPAALPVRHPAVSASEAVPAGTGCFSIPQRGEHVSEVNGMPLQNSSQQQQQQQQQQTFLSSTQQATGHATADSSPPSAGWVTLPTADAAAAAGTSVVAGAAEPKVDVVVAAAAAARLTSAAAPSDAGWFALPLPEPAEIQNTPNIHPQKAQQQRQQQHCNFTVAESAASVSQGVGWFSLPLSGSAAANAPEPAIQGEFALTTTKMAAPAGVGLELPCAPAAAATAAAAAQPTDELPPGVLELGAGWMTLPAVDTTVAAAVTAGMASSSTCGTSAQQSAVYAGTDSLSEGGVATAVSVSQQDSSSAATVSSAEWETAAAAAAVQHVMDIPAAEGYRGVVDPTGQTSPSRMGILTAGACGTIAPKEVLTERVETSLAGSSSSGHQHAPMVPEALTTTVSAPSAAGAKASQPCGDGSTQCSTIENVTGLAVAKEWQMPPPAPQQQRWQRQQQSPSSVESMLRYLSYLDSLSAQGLIPPGLTLATAARLRESLVQTITATQKQQAVVDASYNVHWCGLSGMHAAESAAGVDALSKLSCEDMITSSCIDSFVSSSLSHIRWKLGRPPVTAAWGMNDTQPAATWVTAASALGSEGITGTEPGDQQPDQSKGIFLEHCLSPGRHGAWAGGHMRPAKQGHRYTTLEDTLECIRHHRASQR